MLSARDDLGQPRASGGMATHLESDGASGESGAVQGRRSAVGSRDFGARLSTTPEGWLRDRLMGTTVRLRQRSGSAAMRVDLTDPARTDDLVDFLRLRPAASPSSLLACSRSSRVNYRSIPRSGSLNSNSTPTSGSGQRSAAPARRSFGRSPFEAPRPAADSPSGPQPRQERAGGTRLPARTPRPHTGRRKGPLASIRPWGGRPGGRVGIEPTDRFGISDRGVLVL